MAEPLHVAVASLDEFIRFIGTAREERDPVTYLTDRLLEMRHELSIIEHAMIDA